jgi:hypothetical protein
MARAILLITALLTACSQAPRRSDTPFCDQLTTFARAVRGGEAQSVRLARGGRWMVDHYKSCAQSPESPATQAFCEWLMENTSTEFMEANINLAITCVQGQNIRGYLGNNGISSWTGEMRSFSPRIGVYDVAIDLEYRVALDNDGCEDFLKITVMPDAGNTE